MKINFTKLNEKLYGMTFLKHTKENEVHAMRKMKTMDGNTAAAHISRAPTRSGRIPWLHSRDQFLK